MRAWYVKGLASTLAVWYLHSDSELVFVGDAGATEPTGQSERYGVEWTNYYKPLDWLTLDGDFAFTSARYLDVPKGENDIPNSVGTVIGAGTVAQLPGPATPLWSTWAGAGITKSSSWKWLSSTCSIPTLTTSLTSTNRATRRTPPQRTASCGIR